MNPSQCSVILLADYEAEARQTDRLPLDTLDPVLLGLFGEVGSIMATAKKIHREGKAYTGYRSAVVEEFGDTLWYLAALCRRLRVNLETVFAEASKRPDYSTATAANDLPSSPTSQVSIPPDIKDLDSSLLRLGQATVTLFQLKKSRKGNMSHLEHFADLYMRALKATRVPFAEVVRQNMAKTVGRFVDPDFATLPTFDGSFPEEERLPDQFEIVINQRSSGRSYMRWNGVFIGSPLTDNIRDPDGYRFHDVLHLAHVAILHWSPTFRALIKHKRKSDLRIDEAEDGGRAIVVEEGLSTWIFARAKELNYFENQKKVSFDLLKAVQQSVTGYEVSACPLRLWEMAILRGYEIFRLVRKNNGGVVIGDRTKRSLDYKPLTQST
jgi:NTP pyrophosphatase (non-canonical NTP hydrolase)